MDICFQGGDARTKQWIAVFLALLMLLSGCSQSTATDKNGSVKPVSTPAERPKDTAPEENPAQAPEKISENTPLMAEAESLEEAQALAGLYGITLVEFELGLATFATEEDPKAVIRRGQENNWPELTLNRSSRPF